MPETEQFSAPLLRRVSPLQPRSPKPVSQLSASFFSILQPSVLMSDTPTPSLAKVQFTTLHRLEFTRRMPALLLEIVRPEALTFSHPTRAKKPQSSTIRSRSPTR